MKIINHTGRTVKISIPHTTKVTEINCTEKEGLLSGILHNDKRLLWKGDSLYTEDMGWHRINMIKRVGPNNYKSTCMERTDTSMLLFPIFGSNNMEMCYPDYFMNAFLYHETHGYKEGIIWVLMKKPLKPDIRYDRAIDKLRGSNRCVKEETLSNEYTLYTMKLPEESNMDYNMFRLSKFSKMSDITKQKIYVFHNIHNQPDNMLRLQLSKSPVYKKYLEDKINDVLHSDAELRSAIDDDRETFKMSYITEDIR